MIASLADAFGASVAAHDCTGPINLTAALHLATSTPNASVQELTRAFYHGCYREFVTELPPLIDGSLAPLDAPGLGLDLHPNLFGPEVRRRTTNRASAESNRVEQS